MTAIIEADDHAAQHPEDVFIRNEVGFALVLGNGSEETYMLQGTEPEYLAATLLPSTKVPRQCPLVLLVKVDWKGGKTFKSEEGTDEKWREEKS
jgi:hypothetical protein